MILKLLLKIWPSLIPVSFYLFWVLIIERIILKKLKKGKYIDAEYEELDKNGNPKKKEVGDFSLKNKRFVFTIYLSLVFAIISFLFFAIRYPTYEKGTYVPAQKLEDGRIIPGKFIEE